MFIRGEEPRLFFRAACCRDKDRASSSGSFSVRRKGERLLCCEARDSWSNLECRGRQRGPPRQTAAQSTNPLRIRCRLHQRRSHDCQHPAEQNAARIVARRALLSRFVVHHAQVVALCASFMQ